MIKFSHTSPKILIIRFSSFGDIIKSSVLPRLLKTRFPGSSITFITKSNFKELIEYNTNIDHKIYFDRKNLCLDPLRLLSLRKLILKEQYDIIIDAHSNLRSRIISSFINPSFHARYSKPRFRRALLFLLNINLLSNVKTLEYEFYKLIKPLDIKYDENGADLFFNPNFNYTGILKKHTLLENNYICLVPGAAWPGKQLNKAVYTELISMINSHKSNLKIVLLGGEKEIKGNNSITGSNIINLTNKLNLLESIFIASKSTLTIGSDTGLIHGAEAAGGKIAVFLGPTSRETGALPSKKGSIVFEKKLFCRPCSKNGSAPCLWKFGKRPCLNFSALEIFSVIKNII